jgi:hypothetical protein
MEIAGGASKKKDCKQKKMIEDIELCPAAVAVAAGIGGGAAAAAEAAKTHQTTRMKAPSPTKEVNAMKVAVSACFWTPRRYVVGSRCGGVRAGSQHHPPRRP